MTRIEFFFNVENKLQKVAELSASALAKGRRLMVFGQEAHAAALEKMLWTHPPIGFLPHCRPDHCLAALTPIIVDFEGKTFLHDDVVINLQTVHPPFFSRFRRLIEIVGTDDDDKLQARIRYRFYRDRGYEIRTFDATGASL